MTSKFSAFLLLIALAGCGTTAKNFNVAFEDSVKAATAATAVTSNAEKDALKAQLLGMTVAPTLSVAAKTTEIAAVTCLPGDSLATVSAGLRTFGTTFDTVKEVAEKPEGTSYGAYVTAFRRNAANIKSAPAVPDADAANEAAKKQLAAEARCSNLFTADSTAAMKLGRPGGSGMSSLAVLMAISDVFKKLMGYAEEIQREQAVRLTIAASIPRLTQTIALLGAPASEKLDKLVVYAEPAGEAEKTAFKALVQNDTALGATIAIRRWMIAKQISAMVLSLQRCRADDASAAQCLGDHATRHNADETVDMMLQYRTLAAIDAASVVKGLNEGVEKAKNTKLSVADFVDTVLGIGDTLKGITDSHDAYKKAKDE